MKHFYLILIALTSFSVFAQVPNSEAESNTEEQTMQLQLSVKEKVSTSTRTTAFLRTPEEGSGYVLRATTSILKSFYLPGFHKDEMGDSIQDLTLTGNASNVQNNIFVDANNTYTFKFDCETSTFYMHNQDKIVDVGFTIEGNCEELTGILSQGGTVTLPLNWSTGKVVVESGLLSPTVEGPLAPDLKQLSKDELIEMIKQKSGEVFTTNAFIFNKFIKTKK